LDAKIMNDAEVAVLELLDQRHRPAAVRFVFMGETAQSREPGL
jgi:hypothetical protein